MERLQASSSFCSTSPTPSTFTRPLAAAPSPSASSPSSSTCCSSSHGGFNSGSRRGGRLGSIIVYARCTPTIAFTRTSTFVSSKYVDSPVIHLSHSFSIAFRGSSIMQAENSFLSIQESFAWRHTPRRRLTHLTVSAAMFDQLTNSLEAAWTKLRKEDILTRENIKEPMRDIRRALLEADVSLPVVRSFIKNVTEKAVGVGVIRGVRPDQQLVKVVNDELVKLMGGEVAEIEYSKSKPTVVLMAGLQGVGKTTACGKMALYFQKKGKKCMLVATDVYRPAAIDQLVTLGKQVDVPVFEAGTNIKPAEIAQKGLEAARKKGVDVVIVDTAGRLQVDKGMMDELKQMKRVLNPAEVLLVVDAMTGQEAAALVAAFNLEIGITGAILTKLDGDSRGGAALSVKEVSGRPIKFVGQGEGMEALEPFYPDRLASRILGMGDVLSFVEKAEEVMLKEEAEELQKKIMEAKFDFNDFLKQTRALARMGPMNRLVSMIPGMGKVSPEQICEAEKSLKIVESMINSMTPKERTNPDLLGKSPSRRRRVALGSGRSQEQVSQMVSQLFQMRARMKNLMSIMQGGSIPGLDNLEESLKSGRKAPSGTAKRKKNRSDVPKQLAMTRGAAKGFGSK